MTQCSEFENRWSEWHAGDLDNAASQSLWQHAQSCPHCAAYHRQMQSMLKALNSLPAPGPVPEGLSERLFAGARTGRPRQAYRPQTVRRLSIAASILVAVLATALLYPFSPPAGNGSGAGTAQQVVISAEQTRKVRLVFEAETDVENVEYTIELPDGVEVEGYPGLEVLRWTGELHAGRNGLTLPLVGRRSGAQGVLKARIRYGDAQREVTIPVQTHENNSAQTVARPALMRVSAIGPEPKGVRI